MFGNRRESTIWREYNNLKVEEGSKMSLHLTPASTPLVAPLAVGEWVDNSDNSSNIKRLVGRSIRRSQTFLPMFSLNVSKSKSWWKYCCCDNMVLGKLAASC